jgi:hypothetical protein
MILTLMAELKQAKVDAMSHYTRSVKINHFCKHGGNLRKKYCSS